MLQLTELHCFDDFRRDMEDKDRSVISINIHVIISYNVATVASLKIAETVEVSMRGMFIVHCVGYRTTYMFSYFAWFGFASTGILSRLLTADN